MLMLSENSRPKLYTGRKSSKRKSKATSQACLKILAAEYLVELDAHQLLVVLIPSRDPDIAMRGGCIRAVEEENAEWYRNFCGHYASTRKYRTRKFKTLIKRQHTRRALQELMRGEKKTGYAMILAEFIVKWEAKCKRKPTL